MSDRPFSGESAPHRMRQYPSAPSAPGTLLGYGQRPPIWPHPPMPLMPPLPRGGGPLPRPVPLHVQPIHMAGRMATPISHLPPPMSHPATGNPMHSLGNMHRCMDMVLPWPLNALHARSRAMPSEGGCSGGDEAGLRGAAHQQADELHAVGRGMEERASNTFSEGSVIVQKGPMAGEPPRMMHHPRRSVSDESSKVSSRSTSVIVNNHSASPRGTTYSALAPTLTSRSSSTQHILNPRVAVSTTSSDPVAATPDTSSAYPSTEVVAGPVQDPSIIATTTSLVATYAPPVATSSLVATSTTPGATSTAFPTIATSSSIAPSTLATSNLIAPPTIATSTTVAASTTPGTLAMEPTTTLMTYAAELSTATETTVLPTPIATPSMATPPTITSSSPSTPLSTGATRLSHSSHPRLHGVASSAAKQPPLPARPVAVDTKPIIVDPRAPGSAQPASDQAVSSSSEQTTSAVVDRSKCDGRYDSGSSGKDAMLQSTSCAKKKPASLLDCQSNSVPSSLKREADDSVSSSCKRFVISSPGDDMSVEPPMETQENPRISPHPSGSAASDDSDATFDLDSYDEDDDCCNHSNLEVVSGECVGSLRAGSLRVCTKCEQLLLTNGDKVQIVDLSQANGQSFIRASCPGMSSHGETPREYLIPLNMSALLQSRRQYLSSPDITYPLPSSYILSLVCTPVRHSQNSTETCYKIENDGSEIRSNDISATGKYKNGRCFRTSKASSRMKKGAFKSVITLDSTDEASVASGDGDSVILSDSSVEGPTSVQRSSVSGDSPSSHLMDVESVTDLTEYSPAGSERGRWSMEDFTELGAGLDHQSLQLLQDFSPENVALWKKLKVKRSTGETPLHQACSRGLMGMAKYFLLIERVSPNVQDNAGWTSLHEACSHRHHNVARLLLDHGANPSVCAHDGTMPIHDAVEANDLAGVKLLVEYGAGIAPESGERLPLEIAKSKGFHTIVEYLQELMDKTSRAEVKSAKGHTSQFDGVYSGDAKLAGQSYKLDEFRLGPELDYPLFFLSPFFDESEQPFPVAFNLHVPDSNSGRHHNFYLMDDLVKVCGLSEARVRSALEDAGLRVHLMNAPDFRAQIKTSDIYVIPRTLRNSHKQVELAPDCSVIRHLLGIKRVDIEQ